MCGYRFLLAIEIGVANPFHLKFQKEQKWCFQQIRLIKLESPFLKPQPCFRLDIWTSFHKILNLVITLKILNFRFWSRCNRNCRPNDKLSFFGFTFTMIYLWSLDKGHTNWVVYTCISLPSSHQRPKFRGAIKIVTKYNSN